MKAKDIKKFALCLLAAVILTGGTACGNDKNMTNDNGTTSENSADDKGVAGDAGEALKDGAEDLGDDVRDGMEDAEDSIRDNAENATENRQAGKDSLRNGEYGQHYEIRENNKNCLYSPYNFLTMILYIEIP